MAHFNYKGKSYEVDQTGFLIDFRKWDENFAEGMAPEIKISEGLTDRHWQVLQYIRRIYTEFDQCPLVYQTCRANKLRLRDMQELFPTGYLRGACKLAGVTYREANLNLWTSAPAEQKPPIPPDKVYRTDGLGFLLHPEDWDELWAINKAKELKLYQPLTDKHWNIIHYLRNKHDKDKVVPTVYETCAEFQIDIEDMERLFPDGYHRGAVKLAGLRVK